MTRLQFRKYAIIHADGRTEYLFHDLIVLIMPSTADSVCILCLFYMQLGFATFHFIDGESNNYVYCLGFGFSSAILWLFPKAISSQGLDHVSVSV